MGGKKADKRVWKLINIVLKSRSCVWDLGAWWQRAVGIVAAATNKSAYAKHWRLSVGVFLSSQNEQYETHRVRGDFPLVNQSRMVSLSRVDKRSVRDNNSNKNKNVSPNILGRLLSLCVGNAELHSQINIFGRKCDCFSHSLEPCDCYLIPQKMPVSEPIPILSIGSVHP